MARRRRSVAVAGHQRNEAEARAALGEEPPEVRATALGALARMEAVSATDLSSALADPAAEVRRRAAEVTGRVRRSGGVSVPDLHEVLVPDLKVLLDDPAPEVVEMAAWALGELGDPATMSSLAGSARGHADPLCREAAVAALGAISAEAGGSDEALTAILHALGDRPAVRRRAVLALAAFEGPEVTLALRTALTDRDWQVRQAAEDLLAP